MFSASLTPAQQDQERRALGSAPKLRPINSGTLLAKAVLHVALHSAAAVAAAEKTLPFQLSLGTSRSCEKLIHIARAAYAKGFLVGKNDFGNGFNSLSRQSMLDAHARAFPEAVELVNFFYGSRAPAFLVGPKGEVNLIFSEEGSRQGCAAGTEAFCLALNVVVQKLKEKYPEFEMRVLTDDLIPIVPPPQENSDHAWSLVFARYADFLQDLARLSWSLLDSSSTPIKDHY